MKEEKESEEILDALDGAGYLFTAMVRSGGFRDVSYNECTKIIEIIRFSKLSETKGKIERLFNYSPDTIECYKTDMMYSCNQYNESKCDCWLPNITEKNMFCTVEKLERRRLRATKEYREWREAVFQRDGNTCQSCGANNIKLHAHHIKKYSKFPDDRILVDNGISLCEKCHKKAHKKNRGK